MEYSDMYDTMCDAIINKDKLSYPCRRGSIDPFNSNDLGDKVHEHSGELLSAYIRGDDKQMLIIIKKLCYDEIESLIDLVWG